jgi:hypothetical protein
MNKIEAFEAMVESDELKLTIRIAVRPSEIFPEAAVAETIIMECSENELYRKGASTHQVHLINTADQSRETIIKRALRANGFRSDQFDDIVC